MATITNLKSDYVKDYSYKRCFNYVDNNYNIYNITHIYLYNKNGVVFDIDIERLNMTNLIFHGETKRKLKFKLDGNNFIIKNDKGYNKSFYDLYICLDIDGNTFEYKGKYIDKHNHILYYRYVFCAYIYNKPIKDFSKMLQKYTEKIHKEYYNIDVDSMYSYNHYLGMEQEYLKKHMDNILEYNQRIQNRIKRMNESKTFNTLIGV